VGFKVLSNVDFLFLFFLIFETSALANQISATLTTPKCIKSQKSNFVSSKWTHPQNA